METLRLRLRTRNPLAREARGAAGFSLLEVMIAIPILMIGLTGMAALVTQTMSGTERARDMGLAATLVSEKLEDLNRWPTVDPDVAAGGSLTSDVTVGSIDYFDDVIFSAASGQLSETVSTKSGSTITYVTTTHNAAGTITSSSSTSAPSTTGATAFHRRWVVEMNPVVNGITLTAPSPLVGPRRVTVIASLSNSMAVSSSGSGQVVSFQMSMVRP
jgi:Tfp pilus assembly protein PilV